MKCAVVLLFLFSVCYIQSVLSSPIELSTDDLIAASKDGETWFIKFYGQNCGFCKSMKEEWEAFAQMVEDEELDIKVASYDVHSHDGSRSNDIAHLMPGPLPGLHLFKEGKFYQFPAPRFIVNKDRYLEFALVGYSDEGVEYGFLDKNIKVPMVKGPVVSLSGQDFDELTSNGDWVVMVYGPKCGYCKNFAPTYERFASEMVERNININVAIFEGFNDMNIVDRFNARPWPSLVFLKDGKFYRYETDLLRQVSDTSDLHKFVSYGYKSVGSEFTGVNTGLEKYRKLREAKDASKKKKKEKVEL